MNRHVLASGLLAVSLVVATVVSVGCAPMVRVPVINPPASPDFRHGTTVGAGTGVSSASSDVGGVATGSIGWEFTPRVGMEGSVSWLDRGAAADGFAAALTVHTSLTRPGRLVPFVEGGPAMYRAAFDSSRSTIPAFYQSRVGGLGPNTSVAFRDPAFVLGGGADIFTRGHLVIRPAVDVIIAKRNSQSYEVTMFTVRGVYHFEHHPVTR